MATALNHVQHVSLGLQRLSLPTWYMHGVRPASASARDSARLSCSNFLVLSFSIPKSLPQCQHPSLLPGFFALSPCNGIHCPATATIWVCSSQTHVNPSVRRLPVCFSASQVPTWQQVAHVSPVIVSLQTFPCGSRISGQVLSNTGHRGVWKECHNVTEHHALLVPTHSFARTLTSLLSFPLHRILS